MSLSLNLDAPAPQPPSEDMVRYHLSQRARLGSNWFYWIAGLSLVNSIANIAGTTWGFIAGLGITQVIDAILKNASAPVRTLGFLLDVGVALIFVGMGALARKQRAGWIIGLVLYTLDALFFLLVREWIGLAFHAYVLFSIIGGYKAFSALLQLPASPPVVPSPELPVPPVPQQTTSPEPIAP